MSIDSIKSAISSLPKNAYKTIKSVGASTVESSKRFGRYVSEHTPQSIKSIKTPEQIDTFAKSIKSKTPECIKNGGNYLKNHKETIVGGGIIAAAVACAVALAQTVSNAVKQAKSGESISMHRG